MRTQELAQEALGRAVNGQALTNYPAIYTGLLAKGIPEEEIKPRENVFTFAAWRALGRTVKKGEHGVRILTFISTVRKEKSETGEEIEKASRRPWYTTVFHVSQTQALNE